MKIRIRPAVRKDIRGIVGLVRKLAGFEKLKPPDAAAVRRYVRHGFGPDPYFRMLVAEEGRRLIAYAFYFFTYSTFMARPTLYLEDVFVLPEYRSRKIGDRIMRELAKIAKRKGCARMEWCVLDWNVRAQEFYKRLGARHLTEWHFYRIDGAALRRLASSQKADPDGTRPRTCR
jgi:predicted N-acetyltransferase YhbS